MSPSLDKNFLNNSFKRLSPAWKFALLSSRLWQYFKYQHFTR